VRDARRREYSPECIQKIQILAGNFLGGKFEFFLRDVGECSTQVISDCVNVVPLLFGHWRTHIIRQHLSLIEEPLKDE